MNAMRRLSRASVLRLELYLEVLELLQKEGKPFVTSSEIGDAVGISDVKVRQDLLHLGAAGRPKIGYDVPKLAALIREAFGLDTEKPVCLIGFGNLGRALAGSNIWTKAGFSLVAIFDRDPEVVGTEVGELRVRNIAEIFGVVKSKGIETGIIAVPAEAAQAAADLLVTAGVKAIWNFAPVKLLTSETVVVENQSLAWGLITLSHRTKPTSE